jgi:hypothetical protein
MARQCAWEAHPLAPPCPVLRRLASGWLVGPAPTFGRTWPPRTAMTAPRRGASGYCDAQRRTWQPIHEALGGMASRTIPVSDRVPLQCVYRPRCACVSSEPLRHQERVSGSALPPPHSQCNAGRNHRQVRKFRKSGYAEVSGTIVSGLSGHRCHRCSDDACDRTNRNKLKTVAAAAVLYPPRRTTLNVSMSAFPARVPAPGDWIQDPNINPFMLGHYRPALR